MTPAASETQRLKIQGRFVFESVSFGYAYWKPKSGTTHPSVTSDEASLSFVSLNKVASNEDAFPSNTPNGVPFLPVILSEAERSRKIFSQEIESEGVPNNRSVLSSLVALPGYAGVKPLVLVHGFGQSAKSWEPVVACLDPARPVWAFELMGHGSSDCPSCENAYDLDFQGHALLAFLEAVAAGGMTGVTTPFASSPKIASAELPAPKTVLQKLTLVGYSMGGRVVLAAAAQSQRFARVVSDVVLESAGLGAPTPEARTEAAQKDAFHAAKLHEEGLEAFFDYWETLPLFASQKQLSRAAQQAIREERLANDPQALAATFERAGQHCMPLRQEIYQRLHTLRSLGVHITYLVGEEDSKYVALSAEAARAIDLPVTVVPGCGHNVHAELVAAWRVGVANKKAHDAEG